MVTYASFDYLYLHSLMTDKAIAKMPNRDKPNFWLHPGYSMRQIGKFLYKRITETIEDEL